MKLEQYETEIDRLERAEATAGELERFACVCDPESATEEDHRRAAGNKLAELSRELRVALWQSHVRPWATELIRRCDVGASRLSGCGRLPRWSEVHSGGTITAPAVY